MSKRKSIATIILASYLLDSESEDDEQAVVLAPKRRQWRKNWLGLRDTEGFCAKLLVELRTEEPKLYHNFLRMTAAQFDHLLALVTPFIRKSDTMMRMSISPSERLVLTLRYLATGDNFSSLQFLFRIPQTTISRIIPEVLDAIYKVLVDEFLKASVMIIHELLLNLV